MDTVRDFLSSFIKNQQLVNVILALMVFVIGWLVSQAISKAVSAILKKMNLDDWLNKNTEGKKVEMSKVIGKLVYYILLVNVLLITLNLLGVQGVLKPLVNATDKLFSIIPNAIAAGFIGFLGYILAKVISSIVLAATSGIDPVAEKVGLGKSFSISKVLEKLVFITAFIPIAIIALDTLKIKVISDPAKDMLTTLFHAIPQIIGAAIVIVVAYIVGRFIVGFLSEFLKGLGADAIPEKIGATGVFGEKSFSGFVSGICFFFIMLGAAVWALDILNIPKITSILGKLLDFSGNVVIGLIVLAVGSFLANVAYERLSKSSDSKLLPIIAKVAILSLIITMGLHTMNVGAEIIELAFMFALATVSLTIILSFGLGGREAAGKLMDHWLEKLKK